MSRVSGSCVSLLLVLTLCGPARADVVHLTDGARVEGAVTLGPDGVRVERAGAPSVVVPWRVIARIERTPREGPSRPEPAPLATAPTPAGSELPTPDRLRGARLELAFDGELLTLTLVREGAPGAVAVRIPPATVARPRDDGRGPYQDLALLRAPTLQLEAGVARAALRVPVACARYAAAGPPADAPLSLAPVDGDVGRLLVALCAAEVAPPAAEAQLALWAVADRVPHVAGGRVAFGSRDLVHDGLAPGAAALLRVAGLDPGVYPLFASTPAPPSDDVVPVRPRPADPEVAPLPTPPEATPPPPAGLRP